MEKFETQMTGKEGVIERFDDGSVTYDLEKAQKILDTLKPKKFTLADATLILLYAQPEKPIFGRILLVKEIFLLVNEILEKDTVQDAKFVPYHYGPYSFTLGNILSNLEFAGYLDRTGKRNSKLEHFKLTVKGKETASQIWNKLPVNIKNELPLKRKGWDQLGVEGILRRVYRDYPKYADKSFIKGRYKKISWGKGIG